jgi:hypothetical protein
VKIKLLIDAGACPSKFDMVDVNVGVVDPFLILSSLFSEEEDLDDMSAIGVPSGWAIIVATASSQQFEDIPLLTPPKDNPSPLQHQ